MNQLLQMENQSENRDYYLVYLRVNGCYFWFNVLQIVCTLIMLGLLYGQYFYAVTIFQILITFLVALDLMLRYFSEGTKNFAASWDNRINFLILALLIFSISSDIIAPEFTHHDEGVVAGIFLFVRYTIQISRLCKLVMDSKQHLELANQQKINLNEVVEEEHADVVGV